MKYNWMLNTAVLKIPWGKKIVDARTDLAADKLHIINWMLNTAVLKIPWGKNS